MNFDRETQFAAVFKTSTSSLKIVKVVENSETRRGEVGVFLQVLYVLPSELLILPLLL